MKLKNFLFIGVFLFLINSVNAQTTIKIIDLTVTPDLVVDSITGEPLQTDSIDMIVQFKIKNVDQASITKMFFGTVPDTSDIMSFTGDFIYQGGKYYLQIDGAPYEVKGYAAECRIKISNQQNDSYNYITLFVEDNLGQETDRLYFEK